MYVVISKFSHINNKPQMLHLYNISQDVMRLSAVVLSYNTTAVYLLSDKY